MEHISSPVRFRSKKDNEASSFSFEDTEMAFSRRNLPPPPPPPGQQPQETQNPLIDQVIDHNEPGHPTTNLDETPLIDHQTALIDHQIPLINPHELQHLDPLILNPQPGLHTPLSHSELIFIDQEHRHHTPATDFCEPIINEHGLIFIDYEEEDTDIASDQLSQSQGMLPQPIPFKPSADSPPISPSLIHNNPLGSPPLSPISTSQNPLESPPTSPSPTATPNPSPRHVLLERSSLPQPTTCKTSLGSLVTSPTPSATPETHPSPSPTPSSYSTPATNSSHSTTSATNCAPPSHPTSSHIPMETELHPLQLRRPYLGSLDSRTTPKAQSPWRSLDPYDKAEEREYVGFATLPHQLHRKSVKKGFAFTLMVVGESGLGKSTLINSLFLTDLYNDRKVLNAEERISQTVDITTHTVAIEEKGVKLRLTIIDTPGFGDAVNNTESWKEVEDYIDQQFEQYFRDESGINRRNIQDNRVHCCLYFISPFGHGLRPLDVECMQALHEKVNIIPILAKADSLTPAEVHKKKMKIREEIKQFGIQIYQFPLSDSDDEEEDEEARLHDRLLMDTIPFAVIGSNVQVENKGQKYRGRLYPWGVVDVENPAHSDFLLLRTMLVRTHMQDLKDVTREIHYENYRANCIQNMTRMGVQERKRSLQDMIRSQSGSHSQIGSHGGSRRNSGADFPLPLSPMDSQAEKLILEKDEELKKMQEVLERIKEQMQQGQSYC